MSSMTSVADDLNAILAGTEAMLRAVCAETLSPAAVMRVELESSRRARAFLATATVDRRLSVSPGWSDLVESGEALDLLLARLAPVPGAAAPRPLPVAVTARSPSSAARVERAAEPLPVRAPARAPVAAPTPASPAPDPLDSWTPAPVPAESWVVGLPVDEAEAEEQPAYDSISWDSAPAPAPAPTPALSYLDEDDEATVVGAAADLASAPVEEPASAEAWSESQWLNYEEQPEYGGDEADADSPVYSDDDALQYVTYTEPDPGKVEVKAPVPVEELPEWARPIEKDEETDASATKRPLKPKLAQRFARGSGAKVSDEYEETGGPSTMTDPDEEWNSFQGGQAAQAAESTTADDSDRYSSLRGERMHMDDLPVAKTTPSRGEGRSGAAAIQLAADGSSRVLGADHEDEPADIELGDTRDYGDDEALEDDHTGILGVGVLEYDDEIEELDEVDPMEGPINTLDNLPGAPELTPAEISALLGKAEDAGRRNMAEGALLYGDVLDAEPTRVDALLSRGRLYLDLGDFPAAVSDFLKAEGLQSRDPDVQVALGDLFYGRKDYGKAVSYFNRALAVDGDHAVALARRGMAHYYRRQFSAAIEDLERARQLDSSLAHVDMYISRAKKKN